MKTLIVMKQQKLKYFSSLTSSQKNKIFKTIINYKIGLTNLNKGLQEAIRNSLDIQTLIDYRANFDELIKGQKCFYYKGELYPLNINEIINNI